MRFNNKIILALCTATLAACGGGGSSDASKANATQSSTTSSTTDNTDAQGNNGVENSSAVTVTTENGVQTTQQTTAVGTMTTVEPEGTKSDVTNTNTSSESTSQQNSGSVQDSSTVVDTVTEPVTSIDQPDDPITTVSTPTDTTTTDTTTTDTTTTDTTTTDTTTTDTTTTTTNPDGSVTVTGLTAVDQQSSQKTALGNCDNYQDIAAILEGINKIRTTGRMCGNTSYAATTPLTWNNELTKAALNHAEYMVTTGEFSHTQTTPGMETVGKRATAAGYVWRGVGENIAAGNVSYKDILEGWVNSPGHCANLMNPNFEDFGGACMASENNSTPTKWAQVFGKR